MIARGATLKFAGESIDVRIAGRELGARYVMGGKSAAGGARLRLAVQLVDAVSGAHLWAENYERSFSPEAVFELQDELVPRIVSTVADMHGVLPRSMSEAVRSRDPGELSPYEAVLRSFGYFERLTGEELAAARSGLESAVGKAPAPADAWAMLALLCSRITRRIRPSGGFPGRAGWLPRGAPSRQRHPIICPISPWPRRSSSRRNSRASATRRSGPSRSTPWTATPSPFWASC